MEPPTVRHESARDLGRGGAQHQAIQKRIKEAAESLGFRSVIEKPVLDGEGSVDLWLERTGLAIACEISISTTIDHEVGNVAKCLKAGVPRVAALEQVGLADRAHTPVAVLAHGERRQLEIAMVLATGAKCLLLDEPMAGMSPTESEAVVALLHKLKGEHTILLVEHDMDAVFALADRVTVLVYGRPIASGTPEEIRNHPEVREAYLGEEAH